MAVTITDIAKAAGVSAATVSKVINNKLYVAQKTKERVLEAIEKLNFVPNTAAANLARKTSRSVFYADKFYKGLVFENPHMFEIFCGVNHELNRKGYHLVVVDLSEDRRETVSIVEESVLCKRADGMIINSRFVSPQIERIFKKANYPNICIGKPVQHSLLSWIDTNHQLSSDIVVKHLASGGCKKLAFMGGLQNENIFSERLKGFLSAAENFDCEVSSDYITYNESNLSKIYTTAMKLISLRIPPDAIVCNNSLLAVGTMNAIKDKGLAVPKEISVVVFDDHPYSSIITPKPTVIAIDLFSLGVQIGNSILKIISNPSLLIQTHTALPQLLQRESTRHV